MKKSRIIRPDTVISLIRRILDLFYEDRVTVYAAQASFFVIISAVPFLSLLAAIIGLVTPTDLTTITESLEGLIPNTILAAFTEILTEVRDIPGISLVSISALTTLWSASKGIASIRNGLQTVYGITEKRSFFRNRLYSLIYTVCFIVMILTVAVILLFGDFLYGIAVQNRLFSSDFLAPFLRFKTPVFIVLISLIFNTVYYVIGRRSRWVPKRFFFHLPGALLAAVGWNVFSFLYSLYITHFPRAFSLYGGLTAICLIMLWLYFCMIILLGGAEINKIILMHKNNRI